MKIAIFSVVIIVLGLLVWFVNHKKKLEGTPEERLLRHYQKQIQNYTPINLPDDAPVVDRFIKNLKDLATRLNKCKPFVQIAIDLWRISEEGDRPLLVLVMGEFKTGKSTFINTLLGSDVLIADAAPATAVTTMLKYGEHPAVELHYRDGHTEAWSYEKLGEITAEGDETKRKLRESLDYVELTYPNDLLKQINLVDTPGLNVHNESHIRNTENFQHKADVVLWIFNAARSVTQTELREIKALGERLKPFAIVNRIDNIDDEEETVEEVLSNVKHRLGNSVQGIFGLSALQAQKAIQSNNNEQLQESGWAYFLEQLEEHFLSCSEDLKLKALTEKAACVAESFKLKLGEMKRAAEVRDKSFGSQDEAEKELRDSIDTLDELHKLMLEVDKNEQSAGKLLAQLETQRENVTTVDNTDLLNKTVNNLLNVIIPLLRVKEFFSEVLSKATDKEQMEITAFIDDIGMLDGEIDQQLGYYKQWWQQYQELDTEVADLKSEEEQVCILQHDYENSGLFGGEPIFDFSGRRERLNNAVSSYNQHVENLQQRVKEHWWRFLAISKDTYAKDHEIKKLAGKVDAFFLREKKDVEMQLKSIQQDFKREQAKQLELKQNIQLGEEMLTELQQEIPA